VGAEGGLGGEALAADVAVERPVLEPFQLRLVVPEMLLEVRQLERGIKIVCSCILPNV
jgi:hypothetical protein